MELPDVGANCNNHACNRLDFLPYKCQYCRRLFCDLHWKVTEHDCPQKHRVVDVRVPECPCCGAAIPINRGENPNSRVERHIRSGCPKVSGTTSTRPAYRSDICNVKACNTKSLVHSNCQKCKKQYCLKHRHESDHNCVPEAPMFTASTVKKYWKNTYQQTVEKKPTSQPNRANFKNTNVTREKRNGSIGNGRTTQKSPEKQTCIIS